MSRTVLFHDEFDREYRTLAKGVQDELLAHALLLSQFGPGLGRPTVDTLKGSKHANMQELHFGWQGEVWRVAFAFDPDRQAILLVGGDKGGADQKRFYKRLIGLADARFDTHLAALAAAPARKEKRHPKNSCTSARQAARQAPRDGAKTGGGTRDPQRPASRGRADAGGTCDCPRRGTGHDLSPGAAKRHAAPNPQTLCRSQEKQSAKGPRTDKRHAAEVV